MQQRLDDLYPRVSNLLGAYLVGDETLEGEIDDAVATEGPERAAEVLDELRRLLADVTVDDEELTTFVKATTPWLVGTGRGTIRHVADHLAATLDGTPDPGDPDDAPDGSGANGPGPNGAGFGGPGLGHPGLGGPGLGHPGLGGVPDGFGLPSPPGVGN